MSFSYIWSEPIEWRQEIRDYRSIGVEGRYLLATCKAAANERLLLNGKINIRDFTSIPISILCGQPPAEDLAKLSKEASGMLSYAEDQGFLHGWFWLKDPASYTALWDQVRNGDYSNCSITLGVRPVELEGVEDWVWNTNQPLSIETASIQFTREAKKRSNETTQRTGLFGRWLRRQ